MKKILKLTAFVLLTALCLSIFTGCSESNSESNNYKTSFRNYNAKIFDDEEKWIKKDFASNNPVDSDPRTRTFIVKTDEEFEEIFSTEKATFDVDFENQMLIVCTFEIAYKREIVIDEVDFENGVLKIDCTLLLLPISGYAYACKPYQRWIVIRLNKLDVDRVEFEIGYRRSLSFN